MPQTVHSSGRHLACTSTISQSRSDARHNLTLLSTLAILVSGAPQLHTHGECMYACDMLNLTCILVRSLFGVLGDSAVRFSTSSKPAVLYLNQLNVAHETNRTK